MVLSVYAHGFLGEVRPVIVGTGCLPLTGSTATALAMLCSSEAGGGDCSVCSLLAAFVEVVEQVHLFCWAQRLLVMG